MKSLESVRKDHILRVLKSTGGDIERAGGILGLTAEALRRRLKEYGVALQDRSDTVTDTDRSTE